MLAAPSVQGRTQEKQLFLHMVFFVTLAKTNVVIG